MSPPLRPPPIASTCASESVGFSHSRYHFPTVLLVRTNPPRSFHLSVWTLAVFGLWSDDAALSNRRHPSLMPLARVRSSPGPTCLPSVLTGASPSCQRSFHEVLCSTTLTATGSDQHRVYLTQLCCTFRVSHPPGALLHPKPLRPCFVPVTSMSFCSQRLSLASSRHASRRACPPCHPSRDSS